MLIGSVDDIAKKIPYGWSSHTKKNERTCNRNAKKNHFHINFLNNSPSQHVILLPVSLSSATDDFRVESQQMEKECGRNFQLP